MEGWIELSSYSLVATLLYGSATALSFWGMGRLLCGRFLGKAPDFLRLPTESVAGAIVMGMLVEVLAMCNASHAGSMRGVWIAGMVAAVISVIYSFRGRRAPHGGPKDSGGQYIAYWAPAVLMGVALLLAAAAPESRSDEVAYHALASARPLMDGQLRFYPLPWEASVIPQLLWHFALTPLYAVSGAAAAGVVSALFALLLAFSVGRLVQWLTESAALGAIAAFIVLACGYTIVFFTTTGPHAFGYLAMFVAVTAVGWSSEIRARTGSGPYALIIAVGCAGAVASKLTMLPVAAIICCLALWDIWRDVSTPRRTNSVAWIVLVPTLCLLVPAAWTWSAAGSPLGALTARMFHAASFDPEALSAYEGTRELFANNFGWRFEAAYWSLPLVVAVLLSLWLEPSRQRRWRWSLIAGLQTLLILFVLPHELRHFGGIQYPLMASGFAAAAAFVRSRGYSTAKIAWISGLSAGPWALFVLWVATIYLPLAGGQMTAAEFLRQYSGLQSDYEALDKVLPRGATLLVSRSRSEVTQYAWYSRPPIYYAPRPVLFGASQVHGQDPVYLLYLGAGAEGAHGPIPFDPWLPAGYSLGRSVYSNPQARFYPSRTPGGRPGLARLDVFELVRR